MKPRDHFRAAGGYLSTDELYRLPNGEIKYGCSVELAAYDNYTKENFLNGTVIGEFTCIRIDNIVHGGTSNENIRLYLFYNDWSFEYLTKEYLCNTQLSYNEIEQYSRGRTVYGWHISDLKLYDNPKELSEFGLNRPLQSWCYLKED